MDNKCLLCSKKQEGKQLLHNMYICDDCLLENHVNLVEVDNAYNPLGRVISVRTDAYKQILTAPVPKNSYKILFIGTDVADEIENIINNL